MVLPIRKRTYKCTDGVAAKQRRRALDAQLCSQASEAVANSAREHSRARKIIQQIRSQGY